MPKDTKGRMEHAKIKMEEIHGRTFSKSEFEARHKERYDMLTAKIPARYKNVSSDDVSEEVKNSLLNLRKEKDGIYLWGGVGTGKTHTLYAIKKIYAEGLIEKSIVNVTEMLAEIKQSFDEDYKKDILDEVFFMYDDIGAEKESEWVGEQIYRLINFLYENKKSFIFTSNLSLGELAKRCGIQGDRIASRIAEMAHVIELKGNDRRV